MDYNNPGTPKPGTVEALRFPGTPMESAGIVAPSAPAIPVLSISGSRAEEAGLAKARAAIREGTRNPGPRTLDDLGITGPSQK